ncbi:hypothetical protein [Flammeovirga agarivorans]|uniref:Phosphate-selective porin O and P n=1 Tax=Flammeovirga agarivorans TaxID=2726742 RepID=A0A7X8SKK1_9BACT|nr:hypothetical protein [Flammeovirga agarivorans]NLR91933.1 hypothetical protein [Flammeovirga agarivorans]
MNYKNYLLLFLLFFFSLPQSYAQDKPEIHFGGALRFNYNYSDWKEGHKKRGGDFGYDMFSLRPTASYKGLGLNVDLRIYSDAFGGIMLKQGWFDYDFSEQNQIQLGLTQVPFGITPYNSHNWFFSINFYLGLEDDHDMGIKYIHKGEEWEYSFAFFKNAEELSFGSNSDLSNSRYAYDVASMDESEDGQLEYRNKEVNQLAGSVLKKFINDKASHRFGISGLFGGLYNLDTENMGNHYAVAVHYELDRGPWNLKAQVSHYQKSPNAPEGERTDVFGMTAFGAAYLVASQATSYTVGLSYTQPVEWGPVSSLQFYNDFGYVDKTKETFFDSYQNVTGCLVNAGLLYTYFDAALGNNQPWLGPNYNTALAYGDSDADWHLRFNINFGFYF